MNQCGARNLEGPLDGVLVQECLIKVLISMIDFFKAFFLKNTASSKHFYRMSGHYSNQSES